MTTRKPDGDHERPEPSKGRRIPPTGINFWALLVDELRLIADEEWQREVWFGLRPGHVDSPGEQIHGLLSAPLIRDFLATEERVDADLKRALLRIEGLMILYQSEVGLDPDPQVTIDHPQWREIRNLARYAIEHAAHLGLPIDLQHPDNDNRPATHSVEGGGGAMPRTVSPFRIQNDRKTDLRVTLEPSTRSVVLKPGEEAVIQDDFIEEMDTFVVSVSDDTISIWTSFEGRFKDTNG